MPIEYEWRGSFENGEVRALHAEGFGHEPTVGDWRGQVERHSLGWVCARRDGELVGFVNVPWDGETHAFVMDTLVAASSRRAGIGRQLIAVAEREARTAGCQWLHVDFEDHLRPFYLDAYGFTPTSAGLIEL